MHQPLHNLPNSNETSTAGRSSVLVPCAIEGRGYRALFIAQFIDFREANGSHTEGAGADVPLSGLSTNVSDLHHEGASA